MATEKTMDELEKEMDRLKGLGVLVVLEGIDGAGKDTHADLLVSELGFIKTRLPIYENETGLLIKQHMENKKLGCTEEYFQSLMLANYMQHFYDHIKPLLDSGKNVVMTRSTPSMVAYASAFKADPIFIQCLVAAAHEQIDNNYMVYKILLDIPMEVAMQRINKRNDTTSQKKQELFENDATLLHVNSVYQDEELRLFNRKVDANRSIEEIFIDVKKCI